jgi:nitrite reductase (NADH) small subunit
MSTIVLEQAPQLDRVWTLVCGLDELEPLWGEAALVGAEQLALFLLPDGTLYAVSNRDPATGSFVLSRGIVGSRGERPTIASPLHKEVYDLQTGECYSAAEYSLRCYPVRVEAGAVFVGIDGTAIDSAAIGSTAIAGARS